jgi:hypothetical protein
MFGNIARRGSSAEGVILLLATGKLCSAQPGCTADILFRSRRVPVFGCDGAKSFFGCFEVAILKHTELKPWNVSDLYCVLVWVSELAF